MARGGDAASALYGLAGEKPEFKKLRERLRIDFECVYSDQVPNNVGFQRVFERKGLPMFCKVKNGQVGVIFDQEELAAMDGRVDVFESALMSKMTIAPRYKQPTGSRQDNQFINYKKSNRVAV